MPICEAVPDCPNPTAVQWRRRLTPEEMAAHAEVHETLRAWALNEADPDQPPPVLAPMPTAEDSTRAVFACADHAIHLDAAALIHAADCQAPHPDHLPACDCEPESHPGLNKQLPTMTLPTGWTVPAA